MSHPAPLATTESFSLEVPVMARMCVSAANEAEAREIIKALLGAGQWQKPEQIGVPFAIRVTE